jgi:hypothetical protein
LLSGIWWSRVAKEQKGSRVRSWITAAIFAIAGVLIVWRFRVDLGDLLVLMLPLAFGSPFLVIWLLKDN